MTLNPSAAHGLEACTPAQARIHSETFGVGCPVASELGTVSLDVPTLPAGSLTGSMYLGGPESGPITGSPYTVYVVANSEKYGVSVRLKGEVVPNEATGQITMILKENPEQPFSNLSVHLNRGVLTAIANPLVCGTPTGGSTSFVPVSGTPAINEPFSVSPITGCASPLPFAPTQSTQNQNANAGGNTSFTFNLTRPEGNQYLSQVKTTLPPGLVALLPTVTPCGEEQANAGTCPASSLVGAAAALAGSGPTPFLFTGGTVYLTGPYNGAPYGLSIVVPAVAGPFSLGNVVTRATINVDQSTARVTVASVLPTIFKGIPLRLRGVTVSINKQGYPDQPDQLRHVRHRIDGERLHAGLQRRRDAEPVESVPGQQLRRARVQAVVQVEDAARRPRKPTGRAWKRPSTSGPARRTSSRSWCNCPSSFRRG